MDELKPVPNVDNGNRIRLLVFIVLACVVGFSAYFGRAWLWPAKPVQYKMGADTFTKLPVRGNRIPSDFSDKIPMIDCKIAETFNMRNETNGTVPDASVIMNCKQPIEEVKNYYTQKLKEPDFRLISSPQAPNTETLKVLTYATLEGVLTVAFEKTETGTRVTLIDTDLLTNKDKKSP